MTCPRVSLSNSGPEVSKVVAGLWRIGDWDMSPQKRLAFVEQCIDLGVTTFDQADIYGNYSAEAIFGEALALLPSIREKIEIISKCGIKLTSANRPNHKLKYYDTDPSHIVNSVDRSLKDMNIEYLDMLLIHRPDPLMCFSEIADTFAKLKSAGKVRSFGVSNFSRHQFEMLNEKFPLVTNQVEFSPLHLSPMQDSTFDGLQAMDLHPMIWSALGGGQLFNSELESVTRIGAVISDVAAELDTSFSSVIYAWIFRLPSHPIVLTGSGRIRVINEAVDATQILLTREQWFRILEAIQGKEVD